MDAGRGKETWPSREVGERQDCNQIKGPGGRNYKLFEGEAWVWVGGGGERGRERRLERKDLVWRIMGLSI